MKKIFLRSSYGLLLTLSISFGGVAQEVVEGRVTDTKGVPIAFASVYLQGSFDGAATDSLGHFRFPTDEKLPLRIVASHLNYHSDTIMIRDLDGMRNVRFRLRETTDYKLSEVVVSVSSFGVGGKTNKTVLSPMDVYTNPAGNGDLSMALRQTPGLQSVDAHEGFFVRGGAAWETAVTIEGIRVKRFFGKNRVDAPARSRFETGMFDGLSLSTGGYPAREGGALSGLLKLHLSGASPSSLSIGLSPLFVSAGAGFRSSDKHFYVEQNISVSDAAYLRLMVKPGYSFPNVNRTIGYNARVIWHPTLQDEVKALLLFAHDRSAISVPIPAIDPTSTLYTGRNIYAFGMSSWRHRFSEGKHILTLSAGCSEDRNDLSFLSNLNVLNGSRYTEERDFQFRVSLDSHYGACRLAYGLDYAYGADRTRGHVLDKILRSREVYHYPWLHKHLLATYAEILFPISKKVSSSVGLRVEYAEPLRSAILLPRLSLTYQPTNTSSITLDAGRYAAINDDSYLDYHLLPKEREESYQYNLSYEWRPSKTQILRLQLYDKVYSHLTVIPSIGFDPWNVGRGYARGIDFFWKASGLIKSFEHWLSYSYADARRQYLFLREQEEPDFVARHTISSVMKYWCAPIQSLFNLSVSYHTGMTYHDPNVPNSRFFNSRLPDHFSMSVSYNYPFKYKRSTGVLVLSVQDLFNANSTYGYRFSNHKVNGVYPSMRITSPIGRFYMIGLFINFGIDRRKDIMNTDLKINSK